MRYPTEDPDFTPSAPAVTPEPATSRPGCLYVIGMAAGLASTVMILAGAVIGGWWQIIEGIL